MSVFFQMTANHGNTEGLFRAGIMSSGSSVPTREVTDSDVQDTYDFVVQQVGCSNATDTLACLRTAPAESILAAANNTPSANGFQVRVYLRRSSADLYRARRVWLRRIRLMQMASS